MKRTIFSFMIIVILSLVLFNLSLLAKGKKGHPKLEGEIITGDPIICIQCHDSQVKEWEKGFHGINQVRCFICHGDLEKRFERIALPNNCVMCHSDKVEDLKKEKKIKTCFDCHKGHSLEAKSGSKNIHTK